MTITFGDLRDRELFSVAGVRYIKGQHISYEPHEAAEAPPNAYRPRAPRLYVRFEPTLPVKRARTFQELQDGDTFTIGSTGYVKGRHPAYQPRDTDEVPPNAYRPDAPHLYVNFGPATVVD
jgi:hypothetical protein